jgi:hypothetical protein
MTTPNNNTPENNTPNDNTPEYNTPGDNTLDDNIPNDNTSDDNTPDDKRLYESMVVPHLIILAPCVGIASGLLGQVWIGLMGRCPIYYITLIHSNLKLS